MLATIRTFLASQTGIPLAIAFLLALSGNGHVNAAGSVYLHQALAELQTSAEGLYLLGYQSVEQAEPGFVEATRYIVLDFRMEKGELTEQDQVHQVGELCRQILLDKRLVQDLSDQQYDMVAIAFDEESQYDCL